MAVYSVSYKASTKTVSINPEGDPLPVGFINIGTFQHGASDSLEYDKNHVFYHHVRDLLYAINVEDMQSVTILQDKQVSMISVLMTPDTASVAVNATQQMTLAFTPTNVEDQRVLYTSSSPAIATVNSSGLVTGVSEGEAIITVTTLDGAKTDTSTITVTA